MEQVVRNSLLCSRVRIAMNEYFGDPSWVKIACVQGFKILVLDFMGQVGILPGISQNILQLPWYGFNNKQLPVERTIDLFI